jgi:glycine C-acetyltransferase
MIETNFENYVLTKEGEDLFGKIYRADEILKTGVLTGNEGLGMQSLTMTSPILKIKEKDGFVHDVIMLGSNSYLNMGTDKRVINSAQKALTKYGNGMGAVSNYTGISDLHRELEERIAKFYHQEDAIVFPSGYGTNIGVISALCNKGDVIINDSANHASIFDGCSLSGADIRIYPHGNMNYLKKILSGLKDTQTGRLIITDGVFSMSGECAKLDEIMALANFYGAKVMVDDAHGLGIIGKTGRGTAEKYNLLGKIDLNVGMLSKSPAGLGGYCASSKAVIQYLRLYARTYFFSTALPAPTVGGLIEVFKLFENDLAGREELLKKTNYFKDKLTKAGFEILDGESAIIPVMIYNENILFKFHKALKDAGVYTNIVTYPAVRRKECRLRLCVMKNLDYSHLDKATEIMTMIGKQFGLI